jgi:OmpA-OmpF porin, OOP family
MKVNKSMNRILLTLAALAIAAGHMAMPAFAQTVDADGMTEAEIAEAFKKQKTRGLSIVPTVASDATDPAAVAPQVVVAELPKDEQVNINISFDFDSSALREDQKPRLASLCNVMKATDVQLFRIVGHTDSSGSDSYNEKLSLLRAEEVKRHLETGCGIPAAKMEAVGVGSRYPFDAADPRADANRRVEFQALS